MLSIGTTESRWSRSVRRGAATSSFFDVRPFGAGARRCCSAADVSADFTAATVRDDPRARSYASPMSVICIGERSTRTITLSFGGDTYTMT